jgi:hypothetical protein
MIPSQFQKKKKKKLIYKKKIKKKDALFLINIHSLTFCLCADKEKGVKNRRERERKKLKNVHFKNNVVFSMWNKMGLIYK